MKMKISSKTAEDTLVNILCVILLYIFAGNQNAVIGLISICIYSIWLLYKMLNKSIQVADYLVMVPAVLLIGTNYLLYLGIVLILLYGVLGIKKTKTILSSSEIIGFSLMVLTGCVSSQLNATDSKSAHLYIGVYLLLEFMVVGFAYFREINECQAKKSIMAISWAAMVFGLGYFMTHTIAELFSTAHISIYYISNYGVYSNTLAGLMAPFIVGAIIIVFESKDKIVKFISAIGIVLMALVMLAIQSRGTYLGVMVAVLWLMSKKGAKKFFLIIVGIIIIVLAVSMFIPDALMDSLFGRFSLAHFTNGDFSNGRWSTYKLTYEMFRNHPIIGCGFWQFSEYNILHGDPHNFVLAYLASTGIVGFSGFMIYLVRVFKRLRNAFESAENQESKVLAEVSMCSFIIFVVHGLVEPSLTTSAPLSFFVIMNNMAYIRTTNKQ